MYSFASFLLMFLISLPAWKVFSALKKRQQRWRNTVQHGCAPVQTLSNSGWLSSFSIGRENLQAYRDGTRNHHLQQQHKTAGGTFRTHSTSQVFTIEPANVKATIGGGSDEWGVQELRLKAFMPLTGPGTLTTDGRAWSHARGLCQSILNRIYKFRGSDLSTFDENIQKLVNIIPTDGTTVDMFWRFNEYMIDSSTVYILGGTVGALSIGPAGEVGKQYVRALVHGLEQAGERNEEWQLSDIWINQGFKKSCRIVHDVTNYYVQQALRQAKGFGKETPSEASLASMWAMQTRDPLEIRNQALNVLVAAFDTTSITLTNSVFHLARHPECYQKLRKEALSWDGSLLTGDSIKTFQYLRAVVNETLRLNTPATFNSRIALQDTLLPTGGGHDGQSPIFVPKGDVVSTSIYSVQRNTEIYGEDADSFRPERWDEVRPSHWEYLPFSVGPRVCPGQKLAMAQCSYVLLQLARRFSLLENRDQTWELIERYMVSTSSRNGAQVAWFAE